jgi:myo-inositol-1(or 4)-monophosphatase
MIVSSDLSRELAAARRAAYVAGRILREHWKRPFYEIHTKGAGGPVTTADLEANEAIHKTLIDAFPDYGWLSEESVDDVSRLKRRRVWIVDPLDGTKEFIHGIPEFSVAIALVEDGSPVVGVTYNPIKGEQYWSARGVGCHLGRRRVHVSRTRILKDATVLASRSETARGEWQVFKGKLQVSAMGSVAYKLAMVAGGRGDATFTRKPKNEWDIASGMALIHEAGGDVTDLKGNPIRLNSPDVVIDGLIASNGLLHPALVELASLTSDGRKG